MGIWNIHLALFCPFQMDKPMSQMVSTKGLYFWAKWIRTMQVIWYIFISIPNVLNQILISSISHSKYFKPNTYFINFQSKCFKPNTHFIHLKLSKPFHQFQMEMDEIDFPNTLYWKLHSRVTQTFFP